LDVEERGSGSKRKHGAGPAPKADYMRRMASRIYKPFDQTLETMAETGLEIPEYRYTKTGGLTSYWRNQKVTVQFYITATPANIVDYYKMPVFKDIKKQISSLDRESDPDALLKYLTLLSRNVSVPWS
jgi:hypothetical protein